ncbi:MAG TPA: 3-methyl-2-oxobutanoate hydroxymethyltransferase [Candidatus Hydrogenedens sp.]|nr:3-methyl-2-oxobutanoate hydroxymethyltransferase [Candidatus Hydrogenedens sp.]HPP59132.1 3-methyl-2-oxobutanoate hydroxymethyltransferase [Candidatus Hydrogenedens sp.]
MSKNTVVHFLEQKKKNEKLVLLTAYDFLIAQLEEEAGVDGILVGDSLGMVVMGRENTLSVSMDIMLYHTSIVSRAVKNTLVIADMPFLSYQISPEEALRNAGRLVSEGGAHAVKLEGPVGKYGSAIEKIIKTGIPVMGHIGLTPQSVLELGGYKVQGRSEACRKRLKREAKELQDVGCFSIVLECIPMDLAKEITENLDIPTIGIGAGPDCDGQILVCYDILGWGKARFAKTYSDVRDEMKKAFESFVTEVKTKKYPEDKHSYT